MELKKRAFNKMMGHLGKFVKFQQAYGRAYSYGKQLNLISNLPNNNLVQLEPVEKAKSHRRGSKCEVLLVCFAWQSYGTCGLNNMKHALAVKLLLCLTKRKLRSTLHMEPYMCYQRQLVCSCITPRKLLIPKNA